MSAALSTPCAANFHGPCGGRAGGGAPCDCPCHEPRDLRGVICSTLEYLGDAHYITSFDTEETSKEVVDALVARIGPLVDAGWHAGSAMNGEFMRAMDALIYVIGTGLDQKPYPTRIADLIEAATAEADA